MTFRYLRGILPILGALLMLPLASTAQTSEEPSTAAASDIDQLVRVDGLWGFMNEKSSLVLVSDEELRFIADHPEEKINLTTSAKPMKVSLKEVCLHMQNNGRTILMLPFDEFFRAYRNAGGQPHLLRPDMDEYIALVKKVGDYAAPYGVGLELSLLSPLEIGPAWREKTGTSGMWMHYRKGLRDPRTGRYSVQMWQQRRWTNNKGAIELEDAGVRVFAFQEKAVSRTPYRVVDPGKIVEITQTAQVEVVIDNPEAQSRRIRVFGQGMEELGDLDKVLVVQQYRTPEMDYFSDQAAPFLDSVVDRYAQAGINLTGLYSDEMHIQQDWYYHSHHEHGQFAMRYVTDSFAEKFAERYGAQYRDFAKYLIYFTYGQEDALEDLSATEPIMHVFGASPEQIRATALFRAHYYQMLHDGVVDLFLGAKRRAEARLGHPLESRAHATWAESPTVDAWRNYKDRDPNAYRYEYTPSFIWSNTVQQAAAACSDYFKWGEYLTGNGTDHPEMGWLDRNYYGLALACSLGVVNEYPYAYCYHWGLPDEVSRRRQALIDTYGLSNSDPAYQRVQGDAHREVDVLMLYPMDLVATEERFGSWMTQYGYSNYIPAWQLLEMGRVVNGAVEVAGRRYTTLVALFEPFPSPKLLEMMEAMAKGGGRVIWSGPPPVLTDEGKDALKPWQRLFAVRYQPGACEGQAVPGAIVRFEGTLRDVEPQTILTDLLVDHVYPVQARQAAEPIARVNGEVVATRRDLDGGGSLTFLGYRPRDDQSASLGEEARNWFEVLSALGAYPSTGAFEGTQDNTEVLSRVTPWLCCRFPNGAIALAPHLKHYKESWPGDFARDPKVDAKVLENNPPPSEAIHLADLAVNGHKVTYDGLRAVSFRVSDAKELIAFAGCGAHEITIDGKRTVFAEGAIDSVGWSPVPAGRQVDGGALLELMATGKGGLLRIPADTLPRRIEVIAQGTAPGSRGEAVPARVEDGTLLVELTPRLSGRWLFVVAKP